MPPGPSLSPPLPSSQPPVPPQPPPPAGGGKPLSVNLRGVLWMLLSALGFACMGAVVKLLGGRLDAMQIVFFRAAVGVLAVLPFIARAGWATAWPRYPGRHLVRGLTGLAAIVCSFYALTMLPLATVTAITFAQPLFMIVIAVLFLGETVRWRRWTATIVGFLGVLVMLRPGAGMVEWAALAALGNALFVAASAAQVKAMPDDDRELTLLLSFQVVSAIALVGPAWLVWVPPTPAEWLLLGLLGLLGVGSQAAVIRAYRVGAEASFVAPFDYVRLPVAAALGFWIFGEAVDGWTAAGAAIIVASTLYIARRGGRLAAPAPRG